ncbi:phosphohydrolase [Bacillus sp. FJAT-18019]|nr:phosphohydrolase [Bacillus sp. FJAT-18019]
MNSNQREIIQQAQDFARAVHGEDSSGHDWWHIQRVTRIARILAYLEGANSYLCELSAYLHDIADEKLNESKEAGYKRVQKWLMQTGVEASDQELVLEIISTMSFSGGSGRPMRTLEGQIVQDADRLDAIGAIGVARSFAYSGWKGQSMYDPAIPLRTQMTREEYRKGQSTVINHFYEKLLKLKNLLNTESAKLLANGKHQEVELFLRAFDKEWAMGNEAYLHESPIHRGHVSRIHIAFDDSTAGSLRIMLRSKPGEMVVTLGDNLMVGPLVKDQDFSRSFAARNDWFQARYSASDADEKKSMLLESAVDWLIWPQQLMEWPCVIWTGNAASEQLGLRRLLSLIPDHPNAVLLNATSILHRLNPNVSYRGTFEMGPDSLQNVLDNTEHVRLSLQEQASYREDWQRLLNEDGTFRVLQRDVLVTVPESYYDDEILKAAYRIGARNGFYKKSARIVGEVIGHGELAVSDSFIEYRVRHLIQQGAFNYTGELDAMRNYSVSLVDPSTPEEQWSNEQRLAKSMKVKMLLEEMMEIHLAERGIMEQLSQMDVAELNLPVSKTETESPVSDIQSHIDGLMITYKTHIEQRGSMMDSLVKMLSRLDEADPDE